MGMYLNSTTAYTLFKNESVRPFFVDKSMILTELIPLVEEGSSYLCITRPRRFGKTVMANMIAAFFSCGCDADDIFKHLQIHKDGRYEKHKNQYSVVHIMFNELPKRCSSYEQYIERIEARLARDLKREYPHLEINEEDAIWDILMDIYVAEPETKMIFVLDEWDFILHQNFISDADKRAYLLFLRNLLKDRPYVSLAYMTGILPIAKYSGGSELNMFAEFTMTNESRFSEYFGFTDDEVDLLYDRYLANDTQPKLITREDLRIWYDGYHTQGGSRLYNPRSIVLALSNNNTGNYWTSSEEYEKFQQENKFKKTAV